MILNNRKVWSPVKHTEMSAEKEIKVLTEWKESFLRGKRWIEYSQTKELGVVGWRVKTK